MMKNPNPPVQFPAPVCGTVTFTAPLKVSSTPNPRSGTQSIVSVAMVLVLPILKLARQNEFTASPAAATAHARSVAPLGDVGGVPKPVPVLGTATRVGPPICARAAHAHNRHT